MERRYSLKIVEIINKHRTFFNLVDAIKLDTAGFSFLPQHTTFINQNILHKEIPASIL